MPFGGAVDNADRNTSISADPIIVGSVRYLTALNRRKEGRPADRASCRSPIAGVQRYKARAAIWPPSLALMKQENNHAAASRPAGAVSRRSRHSTRPWSIRASGTPKVGIITNG